MNEIMFVGDSHGDYGFMKDMLTIAARRDIDTIFQLGDFGFVWPGMEDNLLRLNDLASKLDVQIFFLPGNHEGWDQLDEYERLAIDNGNKSLSGFIPITSYILYTGKINAWNWGSTSFAVAGGAYSIDKRWRTPGHSWWEQEELTYKDMGNLLDACFVNKSPQVDVLLTHDAPTWGHFSNTLKNIAESHMHRQKMDTIHKLLKPKLWLHGHYHEWMDYQSPQEPHTKVYGLDCNGSGGVNYVVLDIDTLEVSL